MGISHRRRSGMFLFQYRIPTDVWMPLLCSGDRYLLGSNRRETSDKGDANTKQNTNEQFQKAEKLKAEGYGNGKREAGGGEISEQ